LASSKESQNDNVNAADLGGVEDSNDDKWKETLDELRKHYLFIYIL
jgi:hypothetical protein